MKNLEQWANGTPTIESRVFSSNWALERSCRCGSSFWCVERSRWPAGEMGRGGRPSEGSHLKQIYANGWKSSWTASATERCARSLGNYNFITAGMCVTALSSLHPGSAQAARDHFHIIARAAGWTLIPSDCECCDVKWNFSLSLTLWLDNNNKNEMKIRDSGGIAPFSISRMRKVIEWERETPPLEHPAGCRPPWKITLFRLTFIASWKRSRHLPAALAAIKFKSQSTHEENFGFAFDSLSPALPFAVGFLQIAFDYSPQRELICLPFTNLGRGGWLCCIYRSGTPLTLPRT